MPKASLADHSLEWFKLLASVEANNQDVPYLDELKDELQLVLDSVKVLAQEQATLEARRQQVTRDLQALKSRGRLVAARMRSGLRTRYGFGSEKLVEFGMRPRRRRLADEMREEQVMAAITPAEND